MSALFVYLPLKIIDTILKNLFIFTGFLFVIQSVNAQKVEISASYGSPSLYGVTYTLASVASAIVGVGDDSFASSKDMFGVSVNLYSNTEKWRYGLDFLVENFEREKNISDGRFISLMAKTDYMWLKPGKKFQIYSGLGVGITFIGFDYAGDRKNDNAFAVSVLPVGFKYGGDLSIFLDTHVGANSFTRLGLAYKL